MAASVCKTTKLIFIGLLLVYQAVSQELSSTLHSTPYGVQVAYADEMIVFTCVVRGSNSMAWTSDEYIGPGLRLPLASVQGVGHEVRAVGNDQTVAVLVNTTTDIDVIIVSELRIRIDSGYPVASVQCVNSGANTESSISFLLAGATLVTCDRQFVCPDDTVTCTCATGNSNSLAWMNTRNRLEFMSNDPLLTRRSISGSSAFAVLTESSDTNGVRVITSNFTISTSMNSNDPEIILTCENVDRATTEPIIIPMAENCPMNPTVTDQVTIPTGPGNTNAQLRDSCVGPIVAAIVIPIIVIILDIPIMIFVGIMIYKRFEAQLTKYDKKIHTLKEDIQNQKGELCDLRKNLQKKDGEKEALERDIENQKEQIETLKRDAKVKEGRIKEKETELKDLKCNVKKEKETAVGKLQEQMVKEKEQALGDLKKTMVKEKEQALEELKKAMKEKQKTALKTLETKMNLEIEQVLERGTSVEKEEAVKNLKKTSGSLKIKMGKAISEALIELETKLANEIKEVPETKKETWSDTFKTFKFF